MRIGLEIRALHHSLRGSGQWRYAYNLLRQIGQLDRENEYCLFAPHKAADLDLPETPPSFRFRYRQLRLPPSSRQWLWEQLLIPMLLQIERITVCHFLLQTAPLWKPCKFVVTAYDAIAEIFPEYEHVRRSRAYRAQTKAMRKANRVAAISQSTRRDLVTLRGIDDRRISVLPLAADPIFRPVSAPSDLDSMRRKHHLPMRLILSVFSYEPRKNTVGVIRALAQFLQNAGTQHALVLFGDRGWGLPPEVIDRVLAETGVRDRVRILGRVPDEDLVALYNLAECFVLPSLYEGFGLPALEALACGTPVVAANTSSLPEIVGDAGLLVDVRNLDEVAGAMTVLAVDESRRGALRTRALVRAGRFSWEATARGTLQLYGELGSYPWAPA